MVDAVILVAVVLILVFALKGTVKHFRGQGACCGGGGKTVTKAEIPEKQLQGKKQGEKIVTITGMHCDHCVSKVTKAINRIDGAAAKVSLKRGEAVISYDRPLSDAALRKAIEAQGFQVTEIRS